MASELGAYLRECRRKTFALMNDFSWGIGRSASYIFYIERGARIPSYATLLAIVKAVKADKTKAIHLWTKAKEAHLKAREARYWAKAKEDTKCNS